MVWKYCCLILTAIAPAAFDCPPIIPRDEWQANTPMRRPNRTAPWEYVVIHHTQGKNCYSNDTCHQKIQEMQQYHMKTKHRCDINYNFVIGGDGSIYEGRGWEVRGTHTKGYNTKALGLALVGTFSTTAPPEAQLEALKALIDCGLEEEHLQKNYKLVGHRQLTTTCCPGKALQDILKGWKNWNPRYCHAD